MRKLNYKRVHKITDLSHYIGRRFGSLLVLEDLKLRGKHGSRVLKTICDCGKEKIAVVAYLLCGKTQSCGCLKSRLSAERGTKHGLYYHPLYRLWHMVYDRCYNPKNISYCNYGAKGVVMCDEWKNDFMSFYNWAILNGWAKGLQIDKDKLSSEQVGKIYSPEYCCFLQRKENMWHRGNSRMVEYQGQTKCLAEWASVLNLDFKLLSGRYKKKWNAIKMFETPCNEKYRNKTVTVK